MNANLVRVECPSPQLCHHTEKSQGRREAAAFTLPAAYPYLSSLVILISRQAGKIG